MTTSRSVLDRAAGGMAVACAAESARCLSPDDCFDYLDGRLNRAEIEMWRQHLDVCDPCRILVAEAARSAVISTLSGSQRTPRTLADGETVANRYRIVRFVARGGMGEVYEAFDSVLQQRLALKTLVLTAIDQEEAVARFLDEARIARKVVHPNVCQIWEVGIHRWPAPREGAVPFLTMDYLTGETLAQRIARVGRLPPSTAVWLFRDLCAGLAAVHSAGIVHRDLKSDNVFITADDGGAERVMVMDFGLARALERPLARFASSGRRLLGTPAYMAPEQVEGRRVTPATDIYSLGIVMFEVLTKQVPFSGETAASIALSRLRHEAPKPSSFVPELGTAWDALLARCLARAPSARFADADAVRAALDQLTLTSAQKRSAPRWRAIATTSTLMAAFVLLLGGAWGNRKAPLTPQPQTPSHVRAAATATTTPAMPVATVAMPKPDATALASATAPAGSSGTPDIPARKASTPKRRPHPPPRGGWPARAVLTSPPAPPTLDSATLVDAAEDLLAQGKIAEACAAGERAAARGDASAGAQAFLGRCYMRLGSPERARASYARYLELAPSAPNAEFVRAIIGGESQ